MNCYIFIQFNNSVNVSGTTAATVLTRAIFAEGCKSVAAGMNAMDLRRGINLAVDAVVAHLKSRARQISTSEEIAQVCHCLLSTSCSCDITFLFVYWKFKNSVSI